MARWVKGQSGNPNGKKLKPYTIDRLKAQLLENAQPVIDMVIRKALEGDMTAAKLILDRLLPVLKHAEVVATADIQYKPLPASVDEFI